ncbi:MAG TPA: DMT family transporter [Candidatus Limnocylindrales bacterium]|nr:DMT family transporter [Candidatus Limnocylindrales bacterium]
MDLQPFAGVGLGLLSALGWGLADFGGGSLSRTRPPLGVVVGSQTAGLIVILLCAVGVRQSPPSVSDMLCAALAGIGNSVAVLSLYRALGSGQMGRVAAVAAVVGVGIPVIVDVIVGGFPKPVTGIGLGIAVLSIPLVALGRSDGRPGSAIRAAALSGLGSAWFFVAFAQVTPGAVLWGAAITKAVGTAILLVSSTALGGEVVIHRRDVPKLVVVGVFDSVGSIAFLLAASAGRLGEAAVLSSLYVLVTVILAAAVLSERLGPRHYVGIAAAVIGIALISLPA